LNILVFGGFLAITDVLRHVETSCLNAVVAGPVSTLCLLDFSHKALLHSEFGYCLFSGGGSGSKSELAHTLEQSAAMLLPSPDLCFRSPSLGTL